MSDLAANELEQHVAVQTLIAGDEHRAEATLREKAKLIVVQFERRLHIRAERRVSLIPGRLSLFSRRAV